MSRKGSIKAFLGDGEHEFALPIEQLMDLQEACNAGPPVILKRLHGAAMPTGNDEGDGEAMDGFAALFGPTQSWRVEDVTETIRLGLIGGGMDHHRAYSKVEKFVKSDGSPWFRNAQLAFSVLGSALAGGFEEEPPGNPEGEAVDPSPTSRTESGASETSTGQPEP